MSEQSLVQKRGRVKGVVTRLKIFADNIVDSTSVEDISVRLQNLEEAWNEFKAIEDSLLLFENQTSDIEEYERKYYETKAIFTRALNRRSIRSNEDVSFAEQFSSTMNHFITQQQDFLQSMSQRNNSSSASNGSFLTARLPKLNIPIFSGEYAEWPSFKDLFIASVHNNSSLSASQKFQYLKGLLSHSAATVIKHLTISDSNYTEAWSKLVKRFDKRNQIVTSFIKTFVAHPGISQPGARSLRTLCDVFDEVIRGLKALGSEAESRDPWLIYLALSKLDNETKELWAEKMTDLEFPTFEYFLEFLSKRCDALETCNTFMKRPTAHVKSLVATSARKQDSSFTICPRCSGNHRIYQCKVFKSESPEKRKSFVISKTLCFKCLGSSHSVKTCRSKIQCRLCKAKHHPLLHSSTQNISKNVSHAFGSIDETSSSEPLHATLATNLNEAPTNSKGSVSRPMSSPTNSELHASPATLSSLNACLKGTTHCDVPASKVVEQKLSYFLPTAVVHVRDCQGNLVPCRALLDSGSQVSLISEPCAQRLGLRRENARLSITGLQSCRGGYTKGKLNIDISSRWNLESKINVTVFILSKLTSKIPSVSQDIPRNLDVNKLNLADPQFHVPAHIDIILGADHFLEILLGEKLRNELGQPIAQNTIFGWVFFGGLYPPETTALTLTTSIEDLDRTLQRFWQIEELNQSSTQPLTAEEVDCEQHFTQNMSLDKNGRYVVALPFKKSMLQLGESKFKAIKRLNSMERRFVKVPTLKEPYIKFMQEYLSLGHMEPIPEKEIDIKEQECYYLPHHAVFKNEPIPKIRVVFDGSCKSSTGVSLNDILMVGPTIQRDLQAILLSFRKPRIAFAGDIEKMYRQVLVAPANRDYQRIVWRENVLAPITHYRLKTVTYGTASAPFLATRVLHQIGESIKQQSPEAAKVIQSNFYVDDLLSGCSTVKEAVLVTETISNSLAAHGLNLTKWKSNSPEFLKHKCVASSDSHSLEIDSNSQMTKVLGVWWNPKEDVFSFTSSPIDSPIVSKRTVLSESSRIFDPLGWLAPVIVVIKILFQELWITKQGWDDQLSPEKRKKWECWKSELKELTRIKIPRRIWIEPENVQLHGFSDASEAAYAAVVYCRSQSHQNVVEVRIVSAKTKVAPIKQISLPRLELCAASLLARLIEKIKRSLELNDIPVYTWTDSEIVLSWLSDVPRKWKTYVANRTAAILEKVPRCHWRHVPSKQNPADLATRGISPRDLPTKQLWWSGPKWLSQDSDNWPTVTPQTCEAKVEILKEQRTKYIVSYFEEALEDTFLKTVNRFSSLSTLIRVVAYCFRFVFNCRVKGSKRSLGYLSPQETDHAMSSIIKCTQERNFSQEINDLIKKKGISKKSPLSSLSPFIDEKGILRVGGRLHKSHENFTAKHPIILPKSSHFTELIVRNTHQTHLHPGTSLLVSILRQRYWILGARDLARRISKKCLSCFRQRATRPSQLMGTLPESRVTVTRPFYNVGIDYAGPLLLRANLGRTLKTAKAYIALFICMATKALHLELVSSLNTDAFIAALRRFISRRGIPSFIYSDNGTNFVGAKRHLNELHQFLLTKETNEKLSYFLAESRIRWSFIPPNAPNFGGLWEINVKAVKWHLRRVVGESVLTFEEMTTLLHQIEAVLNSRPYCSLSADPDDLDALTPGHFLIGQPLTTIPDPDLTELPISRLGRWQHVQAMVQGFAKRWKLEYLTSLQPRHKWRTETNSLKKDELVVIHDDGLPPSRWLLGRIESTHPGEDGLVRVVTVRTKKGLLKRSISKVYKLPVD